MDRRLVAQSGLLVMPGTLGPPLDVLLNAYDDETPLIEKVVFVQNSSEGTISRLSLVDPRAGGDSGSMPNLSGGGWNVFGGK
jgi:hypothetical protein